jgi:nitrile hydratase beta subunit
MNGAQDLGGMHGFGPVEPEMNEPVFHNEWERRVFALTVAMGASGEWNIDKSRAARESLPPVEYLSSTYYQIWFAALKKLLVNTGLATEEEVRDGKFRIPATRVVRTLMAEEVTTALAKGSPSERAAGVPAQYKVGDRVRSRQMNPTTHSRLPRYCRDKQGTIVKVHGMHVFPDTSALGQGEQPQWLYTVRFAANELWGEHTTASSVFVDCWESYLEVNE